MALTAVGLPALTAILVGLRATLALESVLLLYLLAVVVIAVVGGVLSAVIAAMLSLLLANYFFTTPLHTLRVDQRDSVIALIVFVLVAVTVSVTVEVAARNRIAAERSRLEAELLSRFSAQPVDDFSLSAILHQVQDTFGMTSVALVSGYGDHRQVHASVGPRLRGGHAISVPAGGGRLLVADGPELFAEDRRLLSRLAASAARSWEAQQLAGEAAQARELVEVDRLRSALLAAVGHDLRTPLASIKAAVSSLRQRDVTWAAADLESFFETIEDSADRLDDLIANLLAMSRLQAGALSATPSHVALDEIVARTLISIHADDVLTNVPDDLPLVYADPGLLERVLANLVANARRFSPAASQVRLDAAVRPDGRVRLVVIDSGPGVPPADWERIFAPFQRLDDNRSGAGVGLGLAIARGFTEAMGGTLSPSNTPGGGLTMTLDLPVAP